MLCPRRVFGQPLRQGTCARRLILLNANTRRQENSPLEIPQWKLVGAGCWCFGGAGSWPLMHMRSDCLRLLRLRPDLVHKPPLHSGPASGPQHNEILSQNVATVKRRHCGFADLDFGRDGGLTPLARIAHGAVATFARTWGATPDSARICDIKTMTVRGGIHEDRAPSGLASGSGGRGSRRARVANGSPASGSAGFHARQHVPRTGG